MENSDPGLIDVHAHFADPDAMAAMARIAPTAVPALERDGDRWIGRMPDGGVRPVEPALVDLGLRLRHLDERGVAVQVLAPWTSLYLYDLPPDVAAAALAAMNDATAAVAGAHPGRFLAAVGLPMQSPELAVRELQRISADPRVVAVQLATGIADRELGDPKFEPVWSELSSSGVAVILHPAPDLNRPAGGDPHRLGNLIGNPVETGRAVAQLVFSGVLERHPGLKVCLVHGGGVVPSLLGRWDHGWRLTPPERRRIAEPPSRFATRFWYDDLTHDPLIARHLIERVGIERVVAGTDYPWDMGDDDPRATLRSIGLAPDQERLVARDNARRLLTRR